MKSFSEITVAEFLRLAASDAPAPGGGGVAALSGCLGAAMASMALRFTVGRDKFAEHEEALGKILADLHPLMEDMRAAIDDDAEAFGSISEAYKLPRTGDEEKALRRAAIDRALTASMQAPLRVIRRCGEAAAMLPDVARMGNPNLLSDVEVAAIMLAAAARAALVNVYANSRSLKTDAAREAEKEAEGVAARVAEVEGEVRAIVEKRK